MGFNDFSAVKRALGSASLVALLLLLTSAPSKAVPNGMGGTGPCWPVGTVIYDHTGSYGGYPGGIGPYHRIETYQGIVGGAQTFNIHVVDEGANPPYAILDETLSQWYTCETPQPLYDQSVFPYFAVSIAQEVNGAAVGVPQACLGLKVVDVATDSTAFVTGSVSAGATVHVPGSALTPGRAYAIIGFAAATGRLDGAGAFRYHGNIRTFSPVQTASIWTNDASNIVRTLVCYTSNNHADILHQFTNNSLILVHGSTTLSTPTDVQAEPIQVLGLPGITEVRPNPTSKGTAFLFALRQRGRVVAGVYDVSGRLVRQLVDGVLAAGANELRWDGRDADHKAVAAGVYFLRGKTANGSVLSGRIVIVK